MPIHTTLNYNQWVLWLENRHPFPQVVPGLERVRQALEHTQLLKLHSAKYTIHIAGTNGKGTTAKALEHLLLSSRESVGLYTSPHLVSTCERLRVNGQMISENEFVTLCEKHKTTIELFHLTHFESLTLFALDYFLNIKKIKWMIFEIGLGGTWDATNAIPHDTSIVTALGFDHMHILGNTLVEIAKNKFGIISNGNTVIHQTYPTDVHNELITTLKRQHAIGHCVQYYPYTVTQDIVPQYSILVDDESIPLSLPGKRSIENISTAIAAFLKLGFEKKTLSSLAHLDWPARMTKLPVPNAICPVYISGDHNEQGIDSLCEILNHSTYKNIKVILGLSKNRSHEPFVQKLKKLRNSELIFTQPQFQGVTPNSDVYSPYFIDAKDALSCAMSSATKDDLIVVTGSLYLCGDLMRRYL